MNVCQKRDQETGRRIRADLTEEREPILICPRAKKALINFLMRDREGSGEGYSEFVMRAIELRRAIAALERLGC